ncbi:MAG: putative membrane protein [uncultured archaeon A07HN63]|nr:MAG: putative membrane protein [uncultured archaeon A07HN63]
MSPSAVQDDPTASSGVTAEPDLDWLSVDDDESIRWASTPHKYSVVPGLVIGIPLSFVLIGIPILIGSYLQYTNTNYVVTNKGLYSKRGILSRDVQQIGFDKVQNISYSQSAVGSSLGYGSVDVSTAGGSGVELKFRSIPEPAAVQELIAREIDSRQQDGTDETATTDDVLDEILVELRAIRSAVTAEEDLSRDTTRGATEKSQTVDGSSAETTQREP